MDMESVPDWPEPEELLPEAVPDWTELLPDLLSHISSLLIREDFEAFRGVCASWKAAATVTVSKVPLLMLSQKKYDCHEREFYSLSKRMIYKRISFPEAMGRRCVNAGFGWILTLAPSGDVCLVNPFSAARIETQLPNVKTFPDYKDLRTNPVIHFIQGAALTANPSQTSNFTVLVTLHRSCFGFWRNGDQNWTMMNHSGMAMAYSKQVGKMYTLDHITGRILVWDPQKTDLTEPQKAVRVDNLRTVLQHYVVEQPYLVESTDGELLMITPNNSYRIDKGADRFGVTRIDLVTGECEEIYDLGKDAVFLGSYTAVSVDATEFPGVIKSNCIYFTDDCFRSYFHNDGWFKGGGMDMGIYDVEDQSIERFAVESLCRGCPPIWIFPSF